MANINQRLKAKLRRKAAGKARRSRVDARIQKEAAILAAQPEHHKEHPMGWRKMNRRDRKLWKLTADLRAKEVKRQADLKAEADKAAAEEAAAKPA